MTTFQTAMHYAGIGLVFFLAAASILCIAATLCAPREDEDPIDGIDVERL